MLIKNLLPREHGAWAILILPYIIGISIGGGISIKGILGLLGILLLFLNRKPLEFLIKNKHAKHNLNKSRLKELWLSLILFSLTGGGIFLWLIIRHKLLDLLYIGMIGLLLVIIHTGFSFHGRERTPLGEILGVGVLTLSTPTGAIVSGMSLSKDVFVLWLISVLYFTGSIFYIKMRKKAVLSKNHALNFHRYFGIAKECLAYLLFLAIALLILVMSKSVPLLIIVAFVPMLAHTLWGIAMLPRKFEIMKQGIIQICLSLIYSFLIIGFWR